jgi:putative ABC transport system permease protein
MNDCMNDIKEWQYETVNQYESKLTLEGGATSEQIQTILRETRGEAIMEGSVEIRANGAKESAPILVTDEVTLIKPTDASLEHVRLPEDGVSMTRKTAELLSVEEGDFIEWHIYGNNERVTSEVAAIYRDPVNQGITMTRSHFESLNMTFAPTAILSAEEISGSMDGVDSVQLMADSVKGWDDLTEAIYLMVFLLIAAAVIMSIVVLYNLGLLSFTEMVREMATLKVMGLKSRKLRGLLLTQNLWFSAIGFALGVPGGLWLTDIIISFSGESFDFPLSLHAATLFISLAFTFGLSILVNLMFSSKIRRLNMVETLKAME